MAPLKESICNGNKDSANYELGNGNKAFLEALSLGYVCSQDSWTKGALNKSDYKFLTDKSYVILKYVPAKEISSVYWSYIQSEQRLRDLYGRPNERNEPLGQFGEFLYCKLFGVSGNSKLNHKGYDLIDPITKKRIQIKVARKAITNGAGIEVKTSGDFDVLSVFWLGEDRKVKKFFEISKKEFLKIVKENKNKKKTKTRKDFFNIKESHLTLRQIERSRAKIEKAIKQHGLESIFDLS